MDNGYPTEEELKRLEKWKITDADMLVAFLAEIYRLWHWANIGLRLYKDIDQLFTSKPGGEVIWKLSLSTGGWSGNEDIISALERNFLFWSQHWESSRRGGHYEFELRSFGNSSNLTAALKAKFATSILRRKNVK